MADVERFIDTAASAGGDGTTRNHTGGTRAYASMSAWESAEQADLVTATDTHRVRCAGSTADTTGVGIFGWATNSSFFITIQGDDAAPDNDGFYDGDLVWSTGHYRIESSVGAHALQSDEANTVFDGIQVQNTKNASFATCILVAVGEGFIIKNCRLTAAGNLLDAAILCDSADDGSFDAISNIVFDIDGVGIKPKNAGTAARTFNVYNNTVFDCTTGIENGIDDADVTFNFFLNTLFRNTTDMTVNEVSATVNHDWNAGEDNPPTGETNGVTIGTLTDAMVDPSNATEKNINVQVKDSGSTLFKASDLTNADDGNVPSVDIVGNTRNTATGTSTSIGAWANISEAAADVDITVPAGAITLTGSSALLDFKLPIPKGDVTLTGAIPTVAATANVQITVPVGIITLTGTSPVLDFGFNIPVGAITITSAAPAADISGDVSITVPVGAITLTGSSTSLDLGFSVPKGNITITSAAPTAAATANIPITVPSGAITLVGAAAALDFGLTVPSGAITLTGFVPTADISGSVDVTVPAGAITLTGAAASLDFGFSVPRGDIAITTAAPAVAATANISITAPNGAITITSAAPTVTATANVLITVPAGAITLAGFLSALDFGFNIPAGTIAISSAAPTVAATANVSVAVPNGIITITSAAPTVLVTADILITVPSGAITLTGFVPGVVVSGFIIIDGADLDGEAQIIRLQGSL